MSLLFSDLDLKLYRIGFRVDPTVEPCFLTPLAPHSHIYMWGLFTLNISRLPPKRDWGPERVKVFFLFVPRSEPLFFLTLQSSIYTCYQVHIITIHYYYYYCVCRSTICSMIIEELQRLFITHRKHSEYACQLCTILSVNVVAVSCVHILVNTQNMPYLCLQSGIIRDFYEGRTLLLPGI